MRCLRGGAVHTIRRTRIRLCRDSDAVPYAAPRPRHPARGAARFCLKIAREKRVRSRLKWLLTEAWTDANFCRLRIRRNRSIARSSRRNGKCEFSARLLGKRPVYRRSPRTAFLPDGVVVQPGITAASLCDWRSAGRVRLFGRPHPQLRDGLDHLDASRGLRLRPWPQHRLPPDVAMPRLVHAPALRALLARAPPAVRPWLWQSPAAPAAVRDVLVLRHDALEGGQLWHRQRRYGDRQDGCLWASS